MVITYIKTTKELQDDAAECHFVCSRLRVNHPIDGRQFPCCFFSTESANTSPSSGEYLNYIAANQPTALLTLSIPLRNNRLYFKISTRNNVPHKLIVNLEWENSSYILKWWSIILILNSNSSFFIFDWKRHASNRAQKHTILEISNLTISTI